MASFPYTTNIPLSTNKPSVDQPNMKINTNSISSLIAIDHIGFNEANGGAHDQVQLANALGGDGTIPSGLIGNGFETIYSSATTEGGSFGTAGELWFVRGSSPTGIQLTGPGIPTITPITGSLPGGGSYSILGYTFLAGGLLMQWGKTTGPTVQHYTTTQPFNPVFPNNCFLVLTSPNINSASNTSNGTSSVRSQSTSGFVFVINSPTSGDYNSFQWIAIGN